MWGIVGSGLAFGGLYLTRTIRFSPRGPTVVSAFIAPQTLSRPLMPIAVMDLNFYHYTAERHCEGSVSAFFFSHLHNYEYSETG